MEDENIICICSKCGENIYADQKYEEDVYVGEFKHTDCLCD